MTSTYRMISLDGGGIRGLTSALMLQALDQEFGILDGVDLIAGNSIGGITAVLLQGGTSIDRIVEIYKTGCGVIFTPYVPDDEPERTVVPNSRLSHWLQANTWVLYESSGLEAILAAELGSPGPTLAEIDPVLVTSINLAPERPNQQEPYLWRPRVLQNLPGSQLAETFLASDAALCTSAAPVLFPPHEVDERFHADGYLYANNPSVMALSAVNASGVLNARGSSLEDVRLLSMGTGLYPASIPVENIGDPYSWGTIRWLLQEGDPPTPSMPYVNLVADMNCSSNATAAEQWLGDHQLRLNVPFPEMIAVDDCSEVKTLIKETQRYMESPAWQKAQAWVEENFT